MARREPQMTPGHPHPPWISDGAHQAVDEVSSWVLCMCILYVCLFIMRPHGLAIPGSYACTRVPGA